VAEPDDETQEERARRALDAIWSGADVGAESSRLANDFTDGQTDRLTRWVKGLFRPRDPS
jgi:hypothetical protein